MLNNVAVDMQLNQNRDKW